MPDAKLDNLKRWMKSGEPGKWVETKGGQWTYTEWMALLDQLKASAYWPMNSDDAGAHLDSLARQYREKREQILRGSKPVTLSDAFSWYAGGLAVVGLASGFFAGSSRTPVIGTLLPLLFALIGGTSGIYIANADLTAPALAERLRLIGRALACFGIACVAGSAVGIVLRLHYEAPYRSNELASVWHGRTQEALQLAALRTKLRMLGVSPEEQTAILKAAGRALDDGASTIPAEHVKEIAAQARQLQAELQSIKQRTRAAKAQIPEDAEALITELDLFCHQTEPWGEKGMPRDLYKNSVELVWYHLSRIAMPREQTTAAWIHQTGCS